MTLEQAQPTTPPSPLRRGSQSASSGWEPPAWALAALGVVYVLAVAGLIFAPGGTFIERLRALDGGICAQLPGHSFFFANQQLPLCSRNTGVYTGFALGFLTLLGTGRIRAMRLPGKWVALTLLCLVALMGVDGFNSLFLDLGLPHLYQPENLLRLLTGLGAGVAMVSFIAPVTNSLLWRVDNDRPSFATFRQLAVVLPLLLLAFLAIASQTMGAQTGWLLYPIAIFSTLGLVMALTLVNLVFILSFTPLLGRFSRWRQVFPVFTIGAALAVIELLLLFQIKMAALAALASELAPSAPLH